MAQEIYCDESGFTGSNMSDITTPFFTYASVAVSNGEAEEFVKYLFNKYKIQNNELKFGSLNRNEKGRKAISEVLTKYSNCTKVALHHKKFNVAGKFFEYIFEPVLADKSSIFYSLEFNKFFANLLYNYWQVNTESAEDMLSKFEKMMRSKNIEGLKDVFYNLKAPQTDSFLNSIITFCIHHKEIILTELGSIDNSIRSNWSLDLTVTSLATLLFEWGQEFYELDVFCDQSKPLQAQPNFFDAMVGNSIHSPEGTRGKNDPISFNLKKEISFVDSKTCYGIQIADIFAGTASFIAKEIKNNKLLCLSTDVPFGWIDNIENSLSNYCVHPEEDKYLDFSNDSTKLNKYIFDEIIDRTVNQKNVLQGIENFIIETDILLRCIASFDELNLADK